MMKLNKKGFMMAEVVVVSAVVLITLTTLYISYNKIYSLYKTRLTYNDVTMLYRLAYYRDCFIEENDITQVLNENTIEVNNLSQDDYLCKLGDCKEKIFVVYNNKNKKLNSDNLNSFSINQTYKDYVNYLSDSVDLSENDYIMLMEHCDKDNENCKYAYLKLEKEA